MEGREAQVNEAWGMIFLSRSRPMILSEFVGKLGGLRGFRVIKIHDPSPCSGRDLDTQSLEAHR